MIENIVIGEPLVTLDLLLGDELNPNYNWREVTTLDDERFLPKLLVKHGFALSVRELRRNRKDLFISMEKPDFLEIKIGKKKKGGVKEWQIF